MQRILADGGMTSNPMFMQMQANTFNKVLEVRQLDTCWGVSKGVFTCLDLPYTEAENVT